MSAIGLAKVLADMMEDEDFALEVLTKPTKALAPYELSKEEVMVLSQRISASGVEPILKVPAVGAWRMLSEHIDAIPLDLRKRLNDLLAARAKIQTSIPCTGT